MPVHSELIRLGFLAYVDAMREGGHDSLWPRLQMLKRMERPVRPDTKLILLEPLRGLSALMAHDVVNGAGISHALDALPKVQMNQRQASFRLVIAITTTLLVWPQSSWSQTNADKMIAVRSMCGPYLVNAEKFKRGLYKRASDAPGMPQLNEEIRIKIRLAQNIDDAKEIAWQLCLDYAFNNRNSRDYVK